MPALAEPCLPQPPLGRYRYAIDVEGHGTVGSMTVNLAQTGEVIEAAIDRKIGVRVLGITVYRDESLVTQTLTAGRLIDLKRQSHKNGDKSALSVVLDGDRLKVSVGDRSWSLDPALLPTIPWDPRILNRSQLLDTDSGRAVAVTNKEVGSEKIGLAGTELPARRFSQRGGVKRDLWFDAKGRLVQIHLARRDNAVRIRLESAPELGKPELGKNREAS